MDLGQRRTLLDLDGLLELALFLGRQVLAVLQEHEPIALDLLRRLLVDHRHDLAPGLVYAVVERLDDMEAVDHDRGVWKELRRPGVERTRHVDAYRFDVALERSDLPLESPQGDRALAARDIEHRSRILVAYRRDVLAAGPLVPEHVELVYADVPDLAEVSAPVAFSQAVFDGVSHCAP